MGEQPDARKTKRDGDESFTEGESFIDDGSMVQSTLRTSVTGEESSHKSSKRRKDPNEEFFMMTLLAFKIRN